MRFILRRLGPWAWPFIVVQAAAAVRRHFTQTPPEARARVQTLLRKSGGRPSNLTPGERRDLLTAARRLRPVKLVRDILTTVIRPARKGRHARR